MMKGIQQCLREGMRGTAQTDGRLAAANGGGNMRGARQNKGERPWPERIDQHARRARHRAVNPVSGIGIEPKMQKQRMRGRTALGRGPARNRKWVLRGKPESGNRFRRKSEQLTGV